MSHPEAELIRTRRLALRAWTETDLDDYFALYAQWEVMRWLGPQPRRALANRDEARARLAGRLERHATVQPPLGVWAVVPHEVARPVGTVLLLPLEDAAGLTPEIEVGWHLHPDHQGRGLITEAARALLGIAALPRVLAVTDPANERSQAVAGRLGMADEGLTDRWYGQTTRQFAV